MACLINTGVTAPECGIIQGGTKTIFIANLTNNIVYTNGTDGSYTNIGFGTSGEKFFEFDVPRGTTVFNAPLVVNGELRSGFSQAVTFNVYGITQVLLNLSKLLATGKFIVGLKFYDNSQMVFGTESGLIISAFDFLGGAAVTDARGMTYTLTGNESTPGVAFTGTFTI